MDDKSAHATTGTDRSRRTQNTGRHRTLRTGQTALPPPRKRGNDNNKNTPSGRILQKKNHTNTPPHRLSTRCRYAYTASRNNIQIRIYTRKYTGRLSKINHFAVKTVTLRKDLTDIMSPNVLG